MSSAVAQQLAEILRESEIKLNDLNNQLASVKAREQKCSEKEAELNKKHEDIKAEAIALSAFRDVSAERIRNQDMIKKHKQDLENFNEMKVLFAREQAQQQDEIRKLKIDLEGSRGRIGEREQKLAEAENKLKDERVKHHDRVLKELAMLENNKLGIK